MHICCGARSRRRAGRYERALAALVIAVAGCSNGTASSPAPAARPPAGYVIVALGDDFTVGLGTSACGTQTQIGAPCATSPLQAGAPRQIAGSVNGGLTQAFAALFAAARAGRSVAFVPLGVNGALTGRLPPAPESPLSGNLTANPAQLPQLASIVSGAHGRGEKVLLLVLGGVNDVFDAAFTRLCPGGAVLGNASGTTPPTVTAPCTASGTTVSDGAGNPLGGILYAEYVALFAGIARSGPDAVLAMTVWDLTRVPAVAASVPLANAIAAKAGGETSVQLANDALAAAVSAAAARSVTVDLYAFLNANPTYLTDPAYFSPDLLHFNDQGYRTLAGYLYQQFSAALPAF